MVIKTMKKGYVNMAKYSDFTIRHKKEGFAVMAMKPVGQSAVSVELGRYPSETEAQKVLEEIMEHWDAIKEAEYYGAGNNFRYISNVFTMPEASKNKTEKFQTFTINGQNYAVPLKVIKEIKEEDEKRYAAKVDFVVKYLSKIANNQELKDFMGQDTDEAVLYNETDIRDVIAQMPELAFYDYYYRFKSICDKQEPNSVSGLEPKKNPVYKWIIGISNAEADGVRLYNYEGTVEQIKNRLISLIKEDKKNDKENWESGSETVAEISDESNGEETCFYGYGSYSYYHIDYTAERLSNIEELND